VEEKAGEWFEIQMSSKVSVPSTYQPTDRH
jgi:hypothetical protein